MTEPTRPCGTCGMPCTPGEYHPYAACLMFKACHNSETVRANLGVVQVTPPAVAGEPVFAFRRKGLNDFCTCTEDRYEELSAKPSLFETRIFYTTPQPTQAQAGACKPDFWTVCAQYEDGDKTGWLPLPGYSNETEHGVKNLVLQAARKEGYKGTVTGRLQELGWEIRPVYLAPQSSLQQPVAVPLTDEQRNAIYDKHCFLGDNGWEIDWWKVIDEVEAAHGIKGGQHGTDI